MKLVFLCEKIAILFGCVVYCCNLTIIAKMLILVFSSDANDCKRVLE